MEEAKRGEEDKYVTTIFISECMSGEENSTFARKLDKYEKGRSG